MFRISMVFIAMAFAMMVCVPGAAEETEENLEGRIFALFTAATEKYDATYPLANEVLETAQSLVRRLMAADTLQFSEVVAWAHKAKEVEKSFEEVMAKVTTYTLLSQHERSRCIEKGNTSPFCISLFAQEGDIWTILIERQAFFDRAGKVAKFFAELYGESK